MTTTVTKNVHDFFDGYAPDFNSIYNYTEEKGFLGKSVDKYFRQTMMQRFHKVMEKSKNPTIKSIIDVGCGPGHYSEGFLLQNKEVIALDLSENMIQLAKNRTKNLDQSQITFITEGYMETQLPKKLDAACLMGFFDYIEHPIELLKKLKLDITQEIYASFPKKNHWLAPQRVVRYKQRNCPLYLYTKDQLDQILSDAGLESHYSITSCKRDYFVHVSLPPLSN